MKPFIRVGVGGWTYEPWRGVFYPTGLAHKDELRHAAGQLSTIEINGTFYGSQKPATFAKWREETPDGFVFAVKAPRYATHRKKLGDAGATVERFVKGGVAELKEKFGPINWQLMPTMRFDAADMEAFFRLLPPYVGNQSLRHAIEVRHESFACAEFVALARRYGVAIIVAADSDYPQIADVTADFIYLRVMGTRDGEPYGYPPDRIERWAERARIYGGGRTPADLHTVGGQGGPQGADRDVFLYFISGHKVANPAAAMALRERLGQPLGVSPPAAAAKPRKTRKASAKRTPGTARQPGTPRKRRPR